MTVILTIPKPPSTNNLFIGSGKRRIRSPGYRAWAEAAGWELQRQRPSKTVGPVSLFYEIQEPATKRRTDLGNYEKAATDLLVTHELIEADDQFTVRRITMEWSSDVVGARVTIKPCEVA